MAPKISVIISTYHRNKLVREAIESVIEQDYEPVELIVVDDSGQGHAESVLREYEKVDPIIMDKEGGWAEAYTTGFRASTGEFIQFLDDDDYLLDGKLKKTAKILKENPEIGVAYCGVIKGGGEQGEDERHYPKPEVSGDILEHALSFETFPLWTGSMLMERDVLEDCMPLADYAGDTDLKIELARRTKFDYVDECLAYYRRVESSKWIGLKKFDEVKRVARHQSELYDQYPEIRRKLLSRWYRREGRHRLKENLWSAKAVLCFLKAAYYADEDRVLKGIEAAASFFGQPGLNTAKSIRDIAIGKPQ